MKRDMDLVRSILLKVEQAEGLNVSIEGFDDETVQKHLVVLLEAGLIQGHLINTPPYTSVLVERLTWAGHDFLDAARSEEIWNQTKRVVAEKTGSISFELLKLALVEGAKAALRQAGMSI